MRLIEFVALGQWLVGALPNSITSCFLGVWLILGLFYYSLLVIVAQYNCVTCKVFIQIVIFG